VIVMANRRIDLNRARREAKALLRAARTGDPEALRLLRPDREPRLADALRAVARGLGEPSWPALVRRVDANGMALIEAAREGRAEEVYRLLEAGAPANARDPGSGGTALHVAAELGWLDVVDVLVGWVPVDKHARDAAGRTALGWCVEGTGDAAVARVLVSVGVRPEPWMVDRTSDDLASWLRARVQDPPERERLPERFGERAWAADVAMAELIARSPSAEARAVGDGFAFVTGLHDNTRNGVVCSRLPIDVADDEIAGIIAWLRERGAPAQWLVAHETEPPDLRERVQRAGCRPERNAVHMTARLSDLDLSPLRTADGLEIAPIRDVASLAAALDDTDEAHLIASLGLDEAAPLRHYAARLAARTVGIASVLVHGTTLAGIELAVAAGERRRGIGRALVLHALRKGAADGCSVATLPPTPATVPFFEALGFVLERYPPGRAVYTPVDCCPARPAQAVPCDSRRACRLGRAAGVKAGPALAPASSHSACAALRGFRTADLVLSVPMGALRPHPGHETERYSGVRQIVVTDC
jgi:GNAT superfamily N-acetyltransferase